MSYLYLHDRIGHSTTVVVAVVAICHPPLLPSSSSSSEMMNLDGWMESFTMSFNI
jgi:hypothetical protein